MEITFINKTNQDMHAYEGFFQTIAKRTEKELKLAKDLEISVTFVRSRTNSYHQSRLSWDRSTNGCH